MNRLERAECKPDPAQFICHGSVTTVAYRHGAHISTGAKNEPLHLTAVCIESLYFWTKPAFPSAALISLKLASNCAFSFSSMEQFDGGTQDIKNRGRDHEAHNKMIMGDAYVELEDGVRAGAAAEETPAE